MRRRTREESEQSRAPEAGYTLTEVVVAFAMVAVMCLAGAALLVNASSQAAAFAQRQAAPALANAALERLQAGDVTATTALTTGLARGRAQADVNAQWTAPGAPDLSGSWPAFDPGASNAGSGSALIPLSTTSVVGTTTYTVTTYIGVCDLRRSTATPTCEPPSSGGTAADDSVRMITAWVQVTWSPSGGTTCTQRKCNYTVSTLLDPSADLTWRP